jgi:hypothetical protein
MCIRCAVIVFGQQPTLNGCPLILTSRPTTFGSEVRWVLQNFSLRTTSDTGEDDSAKFSYRVYKSLRQQQVRDVPARDEPDENRRTERQQ